MTDLVELLRHIPPSACDYSEWTQVGMALKHEGYPCSVWDDWSAGDPKRYHTGECRKKWDTFNEMTGTIVTGGTIYQMAVDHGWRPEVVGHPIEFGGVISAEAEDGVVVDPNWVESREITEPAKWDPVQQAVDYLELLFEPAEIVGYVMQSYYDADKQKYIPQNKGTYTRTARELIEKLKTCKGDIGAALGDYDPGGGAWIRFNPLDGQGVGNRNVTEYRFALVESDSLELEKQNAIIRELELPVAALVYSGGKSLHAIAHIDAADYDEYRKRVDFLYDICGKNGLQIDTQNRNPSRLSRFPGMQRGDKKQFIIDKNIGKKSWSEWKDFIDSVNDDMPDFENLADVWGAIPDLAPELISGILRQGHKMLLAGPSKAGKSFLQIELAISIAAGRSWLGHRCAAGRVLYVNLELDRASCLHRFRDVYAALGWPSDSISNIDIWNLRGKAVPMDRLVPRLVRRAQRINPIAIIIDPIYKVITGDENSAEQMAKFCNQFDRIATELGCAVVYCHHHSKGEQSGKKSMDRASGSGVFARDPDAQLDLIELPVDEELRKQQIDRAICDEIVEDGWAERACENYREEWSQDDLLVVNRLVPLCENNLDEYQLVQFRRCIAAVTERESQKTAWQMDATLREFPNTEPVNLWFTYPVHVLDESGVLQDVRPNGRHSDGAGRSREERKRENRERQANRFIVAFKNLEMSGEPVSLGALADALEIKKKSLGDMWLGRRNLYGLADQFETYYGEEGMRYVRRRADYVDENGCE